MSIEAEYKWVIDTLDEYFRVDLHVKDYNNLVVATVVFELEQDFAFVNLVLRHGGQVDAYVFADEYDINNSDDKVKELEGLIKKLDKRIMFLRENAK